jgi:hypothetical protein
LTTDRRPLAGDSCGSDSCGRPNGDIGGGWGGEIFLEGNGSERGRVAWSGVGAIDFTAGDRNGGNLILRIPGISLFLGLYPTSRGFSFLSKFLEQLAGKILIRHSRL